MNNTNETGVEMSVESPKRRGRKRDPNSARQIYLAGAAARALARAEKRSAREAEKAEKAKAREEARAKRAEERAAKAEAVAKAKAERAAAKSAVEA